MKKRNFHLNKISFVFFFFFLVFFGFGNPFSCKIFFYHGENNLVLKNFSPIVKRNLIVAILEFYLCTMPDLKEENGQLKIEENLCLLQVLPKIMLQNMKCSGAAFKAENAYGRKFSENINNQSVLILNIISFDRYKSCHNWKQ